MLDRVMNGLQGVENLKLHFRPCLFLCFKSAFEKI
jgi:hypothetical protein